MKKKKVSFTSMNTSVCGRWYTFAYVQKRNKYRRDEDSKLGIVVHANLATRLSQEYGVPFEPRATLASFQEKNEAEEIVNNFNYKGFIGKRKVLAIEKEFTASLNDEWDVVGQMDLLLESLCGKKVEVVDWKGGRKMTAADADEQGLFYALLLRKLHGYEEVTFTKHFLRTNTTYTHTYYAGEIDRFERHLIQVCAILDQFHEKPESARADCGEHCVSCPFRHICDADEGIPETPEDVMRILEFAKAKTSFANATLKKMAEKNDGFVISAEGEGYHFKANTSYVVGSGSTMKKDDIILRVIKDNPSLAARYLEFDKVKLTKEIAEYAMANYNVPISPRESNSWAKMGKDDFYVITSKDVDPGEFKEEVNPETGEILNKEVA